MLWALVLMGLACLIRSGIEFVRGKKDAASKSLKNAMIVLAVAVALGVLLSALGLDIVADNSATTLEGQNYGY